jgi:hypothetical protein
MQALEQERQRGMNVTRNSDRVQRGPNGNDFISLPRKVASPMSTAVSKYWTRRVVQRETRSGRGEIVRSDSQHLKLATRLGRLVVSLYYYIP